MSSTNRLNGRGRETLTGLKDVEWNWAEQSIASPIRVGILHGQEDLAVREVVRMAIAQINQNGGILGKKIEPVVLEVAEDVREFQDQIKTLLQNNPIDTLFGGCPSPSRKGILPLLEAYQALLWYPSTYEGLENNQNIFYTGSCPNQPVELALQWLLRQQKRCIYLLGSDNLHSKTTHQLLKSQLKQYGRIVVGETYLDLKNPNVRDAIARIQAQIPDLVLNTLHGEANLAFYEQYQQSGLIPQTVPTLAFNLSEIELQCLGEAAAGHYGVGSYFQSLDLPENHQFIANFQEQHGSDRVVSAAMTAAYTQVYLWKQAVELAGSFSSDRVRVAAYGQRFPAPGGLVTLETNHHLSQPHYIGRVLPQGQFEIVAESDRALKPLPWLGVEAEQFNPSEVLVEVLSDVSHWVQRSHELERKNCTQEIAIDRLQRQIADRQPMEEAIQNYGVALRAIFASINDAIFVTDAAGVYLQIAPTHPHNPYRPSAKCLGQRLHDVFETAQADTFLNYIRQALETQQIVTFEYCQPGRENRELEESLGPAKPQEDVWFAASLSPLMQEESVVWVVREITEKKRIEQAKEAAKRELEHQFSERTAALIDSNDRLIAEVVEHRQALNALQDTRAQLEAVLEAVPGIVSWISADLHYLGVNRHLAELFQLPRGEFAGKPIGFLGASSEFDDFVRRFFASPQQEDAREISAQVKGEPRNFLIVMQKYNQGRAAFTVGIDISDRVRAVEGLRTTKDQLEAVLEAVPGIVSWISSDLRYLGVNRHLAEIFKLPREEFAGKPIGFLSASSDFDDFVRCFFASPQQEDAREISAQVDGELRHYSIVMQKYDGGRAAFTIGIDVSDRVRAIEGLRQAEEKYRAIFENTVEGIFQTTPEGRYLSANPALARIYGYDSPEELLAGIPNVEQELYVDPQRRQQFIQAVEAQDAIVGFESQIYRKDGTMTWISENARVVRDRAGYILYYEGTVEDIYERKEAEEKLRQLNEELESRVQQRTTELQSLNYQLVLEIGERKRIETALRQSEAELKALFGAMTDVISVFDSEGRYVKIVATNSELLYSPTADRVGKTVDEVFPPHIAELFVRQIQQVLQTQQTAHIEYCLTLEEGSDPRENRHRPEDPRNPEQSEEAWFVASVSPLPDNCAIWVARNITERRRVLKAIQEAEEKYRSIFENAAEGIFQSVPEGHYLSANPALVRMYGYDSFADFSACIGNIGTQLYVNPAQRQELLEIVEREGSVSGFQVQVYRKDGSTIWVSENVRAVRDSQGTTLYYEGTVQDITQRKLAEDALRLEQERSERLLLNILPKRIAERLKREPQAIAERFDRVTILFADIVDFTALSARISPSELVDMLNRIFSAFDQLAQTHGLEKIKTIGDAYMVAGGFERDPADQPLCERWDIQVAAAIADMALAMQETIVGFHQDNAQPFHLRIGINSGPVVAGVIGMNKFIYDLWGDTVNVASRMESHGTPGKIQVTAQTYELLKDRYHFEQRGLIEVKGRGQMTTYWLLGRR